ncbi:hypothetical protein KEM52_000898, partial [Ascosphaera acerosa]
GQQQQQPGDGGAARQNSSGSCGTMVEAPARNDVSVSVADDDGDDDDDDDATVDAGDGTRYVGMRNHPLVSALAFVLWLVIVVMNVANIVLVGLGKA